MTDVNVLKQIANTISSLGARLKNVESQTALTPVRYTVAQAGYMTGASIVTATTITVSSYPVWGYARGFFVAIDPGNFECEFRLVTLISQDANSGVITLTLDRALAYAHAESDSVIFTSRSEINVKWFGAKGDTTTDNYYEISRAITQAAGMPDGASVYFPAGIYGFNGMLAITAGRVTLFGDGDAKMRAQLKPLAANGQPVISVSSSCNTFEIRDLSLSLIRSTTGVLGVLVDGVDQVSIKNVYILDAYTYGVKINACTRVDILNNILEDCLESGIELSGTSENIAISGNLIKDINSVMNFGILLAASSVNSYLTITENTIYHARDRGIKFAGTSVTGLNMNDNLITQSANYAVDIAGVTDGTIAGNISKLSGSGYGLYYSAACTGISMAGNDWESGTSTKIYRNATLTQFRNSDQWDWWLNARNWVIHPDSDAGCVFDIFQSGESIVFPTGVGSHIGTWWSVPRRYGNSVYWHFYIYFTTHFLVYPANVVLKITLSRTDNGQCIPNSQTFKTDIVTCPSTACTWPNPALVIHRFVITYQTNSPELIGIEIERLGADLSDTGDAEMYFLGLAITEASM